jgi:hypothetical protein
MKFPAVAAVNAMAYRRRSASLGAAGEINA